MKYLQEPRIPCSMHLSLTASPAVAPRTPLQHKNAMSSVQSTTFVVPTVQVSTFLRRKRSPCCAMKLCYTLNSDNKL